MEPMIDSAPSQHDSPASQPTGGGENKKPTK
jgi:hypothetical protein